MKKFIMAAALTLGVSVAAMAQPRAIGGRFGYSGLEVSYEHTLGGNNFMELNAGLDYIIIGQIGGKAAFTYNFMIAQPNWTDRGEWGIYAGPGVTLGYVSDLIRYNRYDDGTNKVAATTSDRGFMAAIAAQVGLEYTFWFPLQLAVDVRPYFGLHVWDGKVRSGDTTVTYKDQRKAGFYDYGLWGFLPTLSVRYRF